MFHSNSWSSLFWTNRQSMLTSLSYVLFILSSYFLTVCSLTGDLTTGFNSTLDFNRKQAILTRSGFTQILYNYIDSNVHQLNHHSINPKCINSLINLNHSLENGYPWAFKMLDASGRAPIDLTGHGYVDMGNFDQCLSIDWINVAGQKEVGQHCLTSVTPAPPDQGTVADLFTSRKLLVDTDEGYSMRIGFCIPSSCSRKDLQTILSNALEPFSWTVLRVDSCQITKSFIEKFWDAPLYQKVCLLMLSSFVSLVMYATWLDIYVFDSFGKQSNLSKSIGARHWTEGFSILTNWNNLMEPDKEMNRCPVLTKCALLQHVVVLLFHAIIWPIVTNAMTIYAIGNPLLNHKDSELVRNLFGEWFMDGLFAYAGTTRALELWRKITPKTSFWRIFSIIIRKMLILNCLFVILIMVETIIPLFSFGPFNPLIAERRAEICSRTFTANLFFHQNYVGSLDKVCNAQTWSLAAEYQLVLFLAVVIWLYKRLPKFAMSVNIVAIVGGLLHLARIFHRYNLSPHPLARGFHPSAVSKWTELVYLPAGMHFWLYMTAPLWVYIVMNPSLFTWSKFLTDNKAKMRQGLYFYGFLMILYPYIWSSYISAYESPMVIAIYIVIYRCFTGIFYSILVFINAEQLRDYFSTDKPKICSGNVNNNSYSAFNYEDKFLDWTEIHKDKDVISVNKMCKKYSSKSEYKWIHILTIVFKSTYCVHIPVLIWYYSQHKWPVITTEEWLFHLFSTVFLSIFSGFVFYLLILGPFNHLTESIKPKTDQGKQIHLKKE